MGIKYQDVADAQRPPEPPPGGREWLTAMLRKASQLLPAGNAHAHVVGYLLSHCSLGPKEALELFELIERNGSPEPSPSGARSLGQATVDDRNRKWEV